MKKILQLFLLISIGSGSYILLSGNGYNNPYETALEEFDLSSRMEHYGVPGTSFAVIRNGRLDWARGYGVLQKGSDREIDTETVFSVGSVSKVGAAVMSMKLQEEGRLDIDADVNEYLTAWQVPENQYTRVAAVTLRRIMSHTAGLTVHGFADFQPEETLPTTVQILNGERPAKNGPVYVDIPIGSRFRYSGGGTTVEQLVIEERTKAPFHKAAADVLFEPLQMVRSSYENPLPSSHGNIAKAHNRSGNPVALPRGYQSMPEAAASGLWTTPSDFAKVIIMLMQAYQGQHDYLSQGTVRDMMTPVAPGTYGLGPRLKKVGESIQFYHGGSNDSYKARFIGFLEAQNGVVIFTNGASGNKLIEELIPLFEPMLLQ